MSLLTHYQVMKIRRKLCSLGRAQAAHQASIHYGEIRPIPLKVSPTSYRYTTDCSGFVTMLAHWVGLPDPNGNGYSGYGFTGTLLSHLPHISKQESWRGDLVVFGGGFGTHVVMLLEGGSKSSDPLVVSHGQESGPMVLRLSDEQRYHAGEPLTFLRIMSNKTRPKTYRKVADGTQSLNEVAAARKTTAAYLIKITENESTIDAANLKKFKAYVRAGVSTKMPKGLVYYTKNKG